MKYEFKFVLRADDYHPVSLRLGSDEAVVKEVLYLDNSAQFISIDGTVAPEGTGNLCTFTAVIESDHPEFWLNAAKTYAELRYLDADVSMTDYKKPEEE